MIRPANIFLVSTIPLVFLYLVVLKKNLSRCAIILILMSGFLLSILPQVYINYHFYQKISFLPAMELGNSQIRWGIENIKYATNASGVGSPALYYKNPFYAQVENLGLNWYFTNIENGIKTILLHLFNVFTYDYYFPYIHDLYPNYKFLTLLYSWFILFYGVMGIFESINKIKHINQDIYKANSLKPIKLLLYVMLPVVFLSALSILSISAVEVRFSLPLVLILLPFAYWSFFYNFKNFKLWVVFALLISCAFLISSLVDLQKNIPYM